MRAIRLRIIVNKGYSLGVIIIPGLLAIRTTGLGVDNERQLFTSVCGYFSNVTARNEVGSGLWAVGREGQSIFHLSFGICHFSFEADCPQQSRLQVVNRVMPSQPGDTKITNEKCQMTNEKCFFLFCPLSTAH